ncbi:MAG: tilS [Planctomycetaceae bacterium]|nr:tilS [Planctomycetaceae bacterium]
MGSATSEFLSALRAGCETCHLARTRVLVAVSGGADSVALLLGLWLLHEELQIDLHAAHLNHQLRGGESDADAAWVEDFCRSRAIPCHVGTESITEAPQLAKLGLEGTARLVRRRFLQRVGAEQHCAGIAVAHTADDQAETILHHIIRGTGLAGLRGMHADEVLAEVDPLGTDAGSVRHGGPPLIRPLLHVERQLLVRFLTEQNQSYRTDSTNADTTLTRNRIRHKLLPLLAGEFNPQIQQALLRLGQQAQEIYADELLLAEGLLREVLIETAPSHCRLRCGPLREQPPQRVRECFVLLWRQLGWPRRLMGFADWQRLVEVVASESSTIMLPGPVTVQRRDSLLMLTRESR